MCHRMWRRGLYRGTRGKTRSLGWSPNALCPGSCPQPEIRHAQRGPFQTQGGAANCRPRREPQGNRPCPHLVSDFRLQNWGRASVSGSGLCSWVRAALAD